MANSSYVTPLRFREIAGDLDAYRKLKDGEEPPFLEFRDKRYDIVAQISVFELAALFRVAATVMERWPEEFPG